MKFVYALILILFSTHASANTAPWVGVDLKGFPCNGDTQGYGPFDYIKAADQPNIPIVEQHHFNSNVQNHVKGQEGYVTNDLDYVIRAIPNHHEALLSMIRYQMKLKQKLIAEPRPLPVPPECYLQRAIHFSPDDASSLALYAYYLKELDKFQQAAELYEQALAINPENAKIAYSYSLLLIDMKQYDRAAEIAKIAYEQGNPPDGLKKKLIKLGKWQ